MLALAPTPALLGRRELLAGSAALAAAAPVLPSFSAPTPVALVTGANSGIGYHTAKGLAERGFAVVLACRSVDKGKAAAARLRATAGLEQADVRVLDVPLELASLRSVDAYADAARAAMPSLDVLCLNAGIMAAPLGYTEDGHELHWGTNALAHWSLTQQLLDTLRGAPAARVVNVSSIAAFGPGLDVDDVDWRRRGYERWSAYCASKRANVLLSDELAAREPALLSVALHPGIVSTHLTRFLLPEWLEQKRLDSNGEAALPAGLGLLGFRSAPEGAEPSLWASTSPDVRSGEFYLDVASPAPPRGRPGGGEEGRRMREALWGRAEEAVADSRTGRVRAAPPALV